MDVKRLIRAIIILTGIVSAFIVLAYSVNTYRETFELVANIVLVGTVIIYLIWVVYEILGDFKQ